MTHIEGHWETVESLEDVSRIIREYYNRELADKMDELVDELIGSFKDRIEYLEDQIYTYDDEYDWDDCCD
jgi:hypothetical protein